MNITFTGYYKKNNYGDDLFEQLAETLAKKYKVKIRRHKIVPISKLNEKDHKPDIVILFGGEVLNDFFLKEILKLHESNPKIIFKAIGVSCNQDYVTLTNKLQVFETVVFRAQKDYLYFKDILGGQCFYCPDMVFSLNLKPPILRLTLTLKKTVGFFLSQTAVKPSERTAYIEEMGTYVRFWLDKDFHVKLFAMCTNTSAPTENDNLLNTDIYKGLTRVEQERVKQYKTTDVILEKFKYLDYAICWRYHAHVLSILYTVPFLSLSTTPKVENLLTENGLTDYSVKTREAFIPKSQNLILNRARVKKELEKIKNRTRKLTEFYTASPDIYFSKHRSLCHYLDEKIVDRMSNTVIEKYHVQKNRYPFSQDKAQFILFCLFREISTAYEYGLAEKITDGMTVSKLKADIGWLINEAILRGNRMIYYLSPHRLPLSDGWLNINYINQDNYKGLHRAGWSYVVQHLRLFDNPAAMLCDLYLDRTFHWNYTALAKVKIIPYIQPWIGFIHHTLNTDYTDFNTVVLFKQPLFLSSLAYCKGLIVLSTALKTQVEELVRASGFLNIRVYTLTHPTEFMPEQMKFTMENFKANPERKIVQVGAWMRNLNEINRLLPSALVTKAVLKGKKMENYYDGSATVDDRQDAVISRDDKKRPVVLNANIQVLTHLENAAYDALFRSNVVFINLIDASAVNTILECIVRHTPIFVNRLPATEEALGVAYPLFYTDIKEVSEMLTLEKIKKGYTYLKKMDKTKFKIETFLQNLKALILK